MQPNRNDPADNWQQPSEQPSQSPYAAPAPADIPQTPQPVVTMTPETPIQPLAPSSPTSVEPLESEPEQMPQPTPPQTEDSTAIQSGSTIPQEPVRWQAHEYIHREKNAGWFVVFAVVVLVLMAIAIFFMQSITFAILIPVMAVALIVYTRRPPRLLDYTLSAKGLYINDQLYSFSEFKGFGVIHDGDEFSVMLIPIKRFRMGVSVYFPEEAGEAIVDMLGARLPMQQLHLDPIDKVIRKLRI